VVCINEAELFESYAYSYESSLAVTGSGKGL